MQFIWKVEAEDQLTDAVLFIQSISNGSEEF